MGLDEQLNNQKSSGIGIDLSKLFNMQMVLDDHIINEHPELKGKNNLDWKILALQVELGECANEWRGFKKWSNDQAPRMKKLLEEYVDCLHFLLSIGLSEFELYEVILPVNYQFNDTTPIKGENVIEQFNSIFTEIGILSDTLFENCYTANLVEDSYENAFRSFIGLGELLGFTWDQVEKAYFEKNAVNHQRQEEGY